MICKRSFVFIILSLILFDFIFPQGNMNSFELGSAIYRDLDEVGSSDHWHAGVFQYFEYSEEEIGYMYLSQQSGSESIFGGGGLELVREENYIGTTISNIGILKNKFVTKFKHGDNTYQGAYSKTIQPLTRMSISSYAGILGNSSADIGYTWIDMIDAVNHWQLWPPGWYENWNGTIFDIDEIRCDGVVEYCYEVNGVEVSNNNNIATPGNSHLSIHNDYHNNGTYTWPELCPKIQAGEVHGGNPTTVSEFDPLISANPTSSNFLIKQFPEYTQLGFKISDNASVKAYIMLQVKKTSENDWKLLIDENNNLWKFRAVDLTEWDGTIQSDDFFVPWNRKYEGGQYASGSETYQIKITVIDQGANYSESVFNFTTYQSSTLATAQFVENGGSGGTYHIEGTNKGTSWSGIIYYGQQITAVSPNSNWVFVGWSDGVLDNPRTYTSPVNISAIFKNHLFSGSSNATTNTSQRKIAQTLDGTYFMVYESQNRIWMTRSSDGTNWTNEFEVSVGSDYSINKSPSIIAHENGNAIAVVWQGTDNLSSKIYIREYKKMTNTWSSSHAFESFDSPAGFDATPVISRRDNSFEQDEYFDGIVMSTCVVWRVPSTGIFSTGGLAVVSKTDGGWSGVSYIPTTNGNSMYPSIVRIRSSLICCVKYLEVIHATS